MLIVERGFGTLSAAFALGMFAQVGVIAHLVTRLVPVVGAIHAAAAVSVATAAAVTGRVALGMLLGHGDRRMIAAGNFAISGMRRHVARRWIDCGHTGFWLHPIWPWHREPAVTAAAHRAGGVPSVRCAPRCGIGHRSQSGRLCLCPGNLWLPQGGHRRVRNPVSIDDQKTALKSGDGVFIAAGQKVTLTGSGVPSTFLHFILAPATDLDRPVETAPAVVKELYRTSAPVPGLKPGNYDLNLTRITFPPQMPSNPPHHRSGAALDYIVSGIGSNTVDGKTEAKGPDSLIYEPFDLVHQWGNPASEPFTFLAFNINPEGVAAVLPGAPSKIQ